VAIHRKLKPWLAALWAAFLRFLRYGTRHHLYFPGDGWPQLDPLGYSSHNSRGQRTRSLYEPLWAFLLRKRLFAHAGNHLCPERGTVFNAERLAGPSDSWRLMPSGDRTCSFCGSLHPVDFARLVERALSDPAVSIDPSDKRYKCYVKQPGVRNASEGGIKFYWWHGKELADDPGFFAQYQAAAKLSWDRLEASLARMRSVRDPV
jgi:hypothetical protein